MACGRYSPRPSAKKQGEGEQKLSLDLEGRGPFFSGHRVHIAAVIHKRIREKEERERTDGHLGRTLARD